MFMSFFKILSDEDDIPIEACNDSGEEPTETWIQIEDPQGNVFCLPLEFISFLAEEYKDGFKADHVTH